MAPRTDSLRGCRFARASSVGHLAGAFSGAATVIVPPRGVRVTPSATAFPLFLLQPRSVLVLPLVF